MKLPGCERALVEEVKVRDYLLSPEHPVGRFKAPFFRSLGYSRDDWARLAADLRKLATDVDAEPAAPNQFGDKFVVRGILFGPAQQGLLLSVWIVLTDENFPRFVTAYPDRT